MFRALLCCWVVSAFLHVPASFAKTENWYLNAGLSYPFAFWQDSRLLVGADRDLRLFGDVGDWIYLNNLFTWWKRLGSDIGAYMPAGSFGRAHVTLGLAVTSVWNYRKSLTEDQLAVSSYGFFGSEPGDGAFVRADIGRASVDIEPKDMPLTRYVGLGALLGAGYAFAGEDTRFLLSLNWLRKSAGNELFQAMTFQAGLMF